MCITLVRTFLVVVEVVVVQVVVATAVAVAVSVSFGPKICLTFVPFSLQNEAFICFAACMPSVTVIYQLTSFSLSEFVSFVLQVCVFCVQTAITRC